MLNPQALLELLSSLHPRLLGANSGRDARFRDLGSRNLGFRDVGFRDLGFRGFRVYRD